MSWKITKKLKETHLAPLSNPFSRSSSTSTIVPTESDSSAQSDSSTAPSTYSSGSSDPKGIEKSSKLAKAEPEALKPGILVVNLHAGKGFSLREEDLKHFQHPPNAHAYGASVRPNSSSQALGNVAGSVGNYHRPHASMGGINAAPTIHGRYSTKHLPYALIDFDKQQIFVNAVSGTPENPLWAGSSTAYKFDVSRATSFKASFFIRNPNAPQEAGRAQDIFLGHCEFRPSYEGKRTGTPQDKNGRKSGPMEPQVVDADGYTSLEHNTGRVKLEVSFVERRHQALSMDDFELLKVVGKGSFGKVMQVMKKDTHRIYAMKTIRKHHIIQRSEVQHTLAERTVLEKINNPFIVPLKFSFQSPDKLYFVLAFVNGGELFHHLQREGHFNVNRARFYTAELLCALECLHNFNVIYRDLKPENILLDYSGHIALCDFGLCKLDMPEGKRTTTFCGTPEYLAPELLNNTKGDAGYDRTVDWWTLGVLLYEMLTGLPPHYDENTNEMYRKILVDKLVFPDPNRIHVPDAAKHLLRGLLDKDPSTRLGNTRDRSDGMGRNDGVNDIKNHPFFDGIDWHKLLQRKYEPQFKPNVLDQRDTSNFDPEFTGEFPKDSYVEGPPLSQTAQNQFVGWSYNRPVEGLGDAGGSVKDPSFGSIAK